MVPTAISLIKGGLICPKAYQHLYSSLFVIVKTEKEHCTRSSILCTKRLISDPTGFIAPYSIILLYQLVINHVPALYPQGQGAISLITTGPIHLHMCYAIVPYSYIVIYFQI